MMMLEAIREVLNVRLLLLAEAALPQRQFQAFRKLVLDEIGNTGLEQDLVRVVAAMRQGERCGAGGKRSAVARNSTHQPPIGHRPAVFDSLDFIGAQPLGVVLHE